MSILKKIFFLCLLVLGMSVLFWGVYNISFKKDSPSDTRKVVFENNDQNTKPEPKTNLPKISAISDEPVLAPMLTNNGEKIIYYAKNSGYVYTINLDGSAKETYSNQLVNGLVDAYWSPSGEKIITKLSGSQGAYSFFYYDYSTKKATKLKENLDEVAWQTNSDRILYKYYDAKSKERTLNIADPDGNNWKKLAELDYKNISIAQIPKTGLVSYWNSGDAFEATDFEAIPLIGGDPKTLLKDKFGADYLWNSSGNHVLVSFTDQKGGNKTQVAVMNYNGGEFINLNIPTFVSKCVWSRDDKTVYYALPGGIPDGSVLPNDYKTADFKTTDTFWKVDTQTGEKDRVVEMNQIKDKYDVSGMFLSPDESALFFVNRVDGKLYRINL